MNLNQLGLAGAWKGARFTEGVFEVSKIPNHNRERFGAVPRF